MLVREPVYRTSPHLSRLRTEVRGIILYGRRMVMELECYVQRSEMLKNIRLFTGVRGFEAHAFVTEDCQLS